MGLQDLQQMLAMNESARDIETWHAVLSEQSASLVEVLSDEDSVTPAVIARLRRAWPAPLVRVALELTRARRKAARKFAGSASLVADVAGVEQATSELVADHKAARFAHLDPARVYDLCCGIGGDAMSLSRTWPVIAVDCDPLRAWMCARNAGCRTIATAVESLDLANEVIHLDPARRDESGRRHHRFADYRPGPDAIARLLHDNPDGAVKLGPGADFASIPGLDRREIEIINECGTLTQAVLWTGRLAFHAGRRTATRLPGKITCTGEVTPVPVAPPDRFLLEVDPAIERAELVGFLAGQLGLACLHPASGLLTAPTSIVSPWLRPFELLADLPWRPRKVKAWLSANDAGDVIIRTRGKAVDPDAVHRKLRGDGETAYTVFIQRFDDKVRALICRQS
jgi:hypothetical protein